MAYLKKCDIYTNRKHWMYRNTGIICSADYLKWQQHLCSMARRYDRKPDIFFKKGVDWKQQV